MLLIIFSDQQLNLKQGAAYERMVNYARIMADQGWQVYLASYQLNHDVHLRAEIERNIFIVGVSQTQKELKVRKRFKWIFDAVFLRKLYTTFPRNAVTWMLFPSRLFSDLIFCLSIKFCRREQIICEKNELKIGILLNSGLPYHWHKKLIYVALLPFFYIASLFNDCMILFYDGVVAISTKLEKWARRFNRHVIRIPILINIEDFLSILPVEKSPSASFQIGFFGAISLKKEGIATLLQTLSHLVKEGFPITLNLFGSIDASTQVWLNEFIMHHKLNNSIYYHGVVSHIDSLRFMSRQDLLVMARHKNVQNNYGFSTKLAEYLVSGTPVLITDVSDNALYIQDGCEGFVVAPGDTQCLIDKIKIILAMNNNQLREIGQRGHYVAVNHFDYKIYYTELNQFILGMSNS